MINDNIKQIYIYCPANIKSGGPELLHQLGAELRSQGLVSYMVYYNCANQSRHTHPEFKKYNTVEVDESYVKDTNDSLVIVPEASIKHLEKYQKAQKAIWWLSVDNYTKWATIGGRSKTFGIVHAFSNPGLILQAEKTVKNADFHFCQSCYAKKYLLEKKKIKKEKVYMLSDYISDNYLSVGGGKIGMIMLFIFQERAMKSLGS